MNGKLVIVVILMTLIMLMAFACTEGSADTPSDQTSPSVTPSSEEDLPPSEYMPEIQRISIHEVKAKMDNASKIVVVDSRTTEDHNESHIVGSIPLPLDDMIEPYVDLEGYEEIVTFCD